jgi:dolichyl-phosphate-mannose--protein O-mannosyl transferase
VAKEKAQNLENHTRVVPAYHMFVFGVFAINFVWRLVQLKDGITLGSIMNVLMAAAFVVLFFYARIFALTVQDRVIRLEMRARLERLLPPDLQSRIAEFTVGQLVSLRFAGDNELAVLARQVLEEKLNDRKAIKRRIKNWQADFLRA